LGGGSFFLPVAFLLLLDIVKKFCESFRVRGEGVWIPDQLRVDGLESPNAAFCQEAQHRLVKAKWTFRGDSIATQIIHWEQGAAVPGSGSVVVLDPLVMNGEEDSGKE
jgi:hypothetical protein